MLGMHEHIPLSRKNQRLCDASSRELLLNLLLRTRILQNMLVNYGTVVSS